MIRVLSLLVLICAAVLFSLPTAVLFFVFLSVIYSNFWEGLLAGLVLDAFYPSPLLFDKFSLGFFTIGFLISFLLIQWSKRLFEGNNLLSKSIIFSIGLASFALFFLLGSSASK